MFVVRGLDGKVVTSTELGKEEKEEQHDTYEQAQQALKEIEKSLPKGMFRIVALDCERCGGDGDVTIIHIDGDPKAYCRNCRFEMFAPKKPVGRPSVGVTKKVSLTLSEENWDWLDEKAEGNRSKFLREIVWNALGNESEWDNYACLGYAILGAQKASMNDAEIKKLVRSIYGEFDLVGVDKANEIYRESDY